MNHHGYGSDDHQFEDFRKRKNRQMRQRRQAEGQAGMYDHSFANGAARVIEEGEQREAQDMQLRREMDEFVRDTTKLAAGVLGEVHDAKDREIEAVVSDEVQDFFQGPDLASPQGLAASPPPAPAAPMRQTLSLQEHMESQRNYGPETSVEEAARFASEVATPEPTPAKPASDAGEEVEFIEFRGEALSAFCDLDDSVEQLPNDDPDVLDNSVREFERISHIEPSCGDDDVDVSVEAKAVEQRSSSLPAAFARLVADPDQCKATLTCLVNGGILERDEARAIYAEMRERWAHCLDS